MRIRSAFSFLALLLHAALGSPAGAQDTVRVRADGPPRWGTSVRLTHVFSFGQVDGPPEYAPGRLGAFAVDRKNTLYAFDWDDEQIRSYDATGKFLRDIGRKGSGPGEYHSVFGLAIMNDSVLAVHNLSGGVVVFFNPHGKYRGSFVESRATTGFGDGQLFGVDRSGRVTVPVSQIVRVRAGKNAPVRNDRNVRLLRFRMNGSRVDSLSLPATVRAGPEKSFFVVTADGGTNNFLPESYAAALPAGGYVYGVGNAFRLVVNTGVGPVRVIERQWKAVDLTSAERANWEEIRAYGATQGRKTYDRIAGTKPVFRNILADNDGRIWISVYATAQKVTLPPASPGRKGPRMYWQQAATYEVLTDRGEYLGRVELPLFSRLVAAQGNRIWVLAKGADDEEIVRSYTMSIPR